MNSRILRRWVPCLILGALLLVGVVVLMGEASADSTPSSIERDWAPVIVSGAELGDLQGTPTDQLFVYAYREDQWQQIPFQVDEVASGVYTSTQGNPLDEDDEIVFMASDLGGRPVVEDIAASLPIDPDWYRIEVTDPLSPTAKGWAYVVRSASLTKSFTEIYASFDSVTERLTTSHYDMGFLANHPGLDYLALNGSGMDILDRTKIRIGFLGGAIRITEEDLDAPAPTPVKDGPVRVIMGERGVVGYRDLFVIAFGGELESAPTEARLSTDFNADVVPATYYNANMPAGVTVDGQGGTDGVSETPLSDWSQVSSGTGTLVQVSDVSESGGTAKNYYKDDSEVDFDDTGDQRSYGDMGTRVEDPGTTLVYVTVVFVLPGSQPNVGEQYATYVSDGLEVTAVKGPLCSAPVADVTINGPDAGTTDVLYTFSAEVDPVDATEPILYTWSEDGLEGGQGTDEASYRFATTGTHVISVTVRNCGGSVSDSHEVVVSETPSCDEPLTGVSVSGPDSGRTDEVLVFTASPEPSNATQPITYTWSMDGLVGGQGTSEASYRWTSAGDKQVEVTARNCGGQDFSEGQLVEIRDHVYLPLVVKE